jgi:hypothetical protein
MHCGRKSCAHHPDEWLNPAWWIFSLGAERVRKQAAQCAPRAGVLGFSALTIAALSLKIRLEPNGGNQKECNVASASIQVLAIKYDGRPERQTYSQEAPRCRLAPL